LLGVHQLIIISIKGRRSRACWSSTRGSRLASA